MALRRGALYDALLAGTSNHELAAKAAEEVASHELAQAFDSFKRFVIVLNVASIIITAILVTTIMRVL